MEKSLRVAYGEALVSLAKKNDKVVVLDADLAQATQTCMFKKEFPDRFFDLGIAEQNLMGVAAGFAHAGLIPFASTFAVFGAGRAYEIIRNSIAYTNLNVKIVLTHAGISVGEDGGSHQSIEDIALMRVLPNMKVLVPCDALEVEKAINLAANTIGPVYVRVARPVREIVTNENTPFEFGKANVLVEGSDACIIACGLMVQYAIEASKKLKEEGINCAVINMHSIKPLDENIILEYANKCPLVVTCEEHSIIGGLGSAVAEVMAGNSNAKLKRMGIKDTFGHSGDEKKLFEQFGLTANDIYYEIKNNLKK